jgi:hypothetical protein
MLNDVIGILKLFGFLVQLFLVGLGLGKYLFQHDVKGGFFDF